MAESCLCAGHAVDYTEQSYVMADFRFGECENTRRESVVQCLFVCGGVRCRGMRTKCTAPYSLCLCTTSLHVLQVRPVCFHVQVCEWVVCFMLKDGGNHMRKSPCRAQRQMKKDKEKESRTERERAEIED